MQFLANNWFFILILVAFFAMHLTGHGGCGMHGHADHQHKNDGEGEQQQGQNAHAHQ